MSCHRACAFQACYSEDQFLSEEAHDLMFMTLEERVEVLERLSDSMTKEQILRAFMSIPAGFAPANVASPLSSR